MPTYTLNPNTNYALPLDVLRDRQHRFEQTHDDYVFFPEPTQYDCDYCCFDRID